MIYPSRPMREQEFDRRWIILGVFALVAAAIVVIILLSRGGGDGSGGNGDSGGPLVAGCKPSSSPTGEVTFKAPKEVLEEGEKAVATVATSEGSFEIELDTKRAPVTANSFAFLADEGFFDGLDFHRIVPEFVIQGGDPLGNGSGGPGYSCVEKPPANLEYTEGVVAMAKSETEAPGTSASQFFVVTGANAGLPAEFSDASRITVSFAVPPVMVSDVMSSSGVGVVTSTRPRRATKLLPTFETVTVLSASKAETVSAND